MKWRLTAHEGWKKVAAPETNVKRDVYRMKAIRAQLRRSKVREARPRKQGRKKYLRRHSGIL